MPARIILCVDLTPAAKESLEQMTEKHGMTQLSMLSRLVEWFARQPDAIRAAAMSFDPAESNATAGLILNHLASGK